MENEFRYKSPDFPYEKEMMEVHKLSWQIEALLDKMGYNCCVIHKQKQYDEDMDTMVESWNIGICNAMEE